MEKSFIEKVFGKNYKTNILGFVVILGLLLNYFGVVDIADLGGSAEEVIGLLMALGFFSAKDGSASHSKEMEGRLNHKIKTLEKEMSSKIVGDRPDDRGGQ